MGSAHDSRSNDQHASAPAETAPLKIPSTSPFATLLVLAYSVGAFALWSFFASILLACKAAPTLFACRYRWPFSGDIPPTLYACKAALCLLQRQLRPASALRSRESSRAAAST